MNSTPHSRSGNADIPIGGFPPLRQYHLAFRPKPTEASAKVGPPPLSSFCFLVSAFSVSPLSSFCFLASHFSFPQPFCFDTLADSPTQRQPLSPFLINHFRALFIATAGVPPPQKNPKGNPPQTRSATAVSMRLKKNNPPSTTSATAALDTRSSSPGACPRPVIAHRKPSITPAIGFSPYSHRQRGGMTVEG